MAQLDSVEIKERLQKAFPKFKFSVTRSVFAGGHSVSVRILSGNVKAFKDDSQDSYISGLEYERQSDKLTDEMNTILTKMRNIIDQVGNYNSRHGSSYLSLSLGSYSKPYVYTSRGSSSSSYTPQSRGTRSGFDYGDQLGSGHGWKLYVKYLSDKDTYVYNLVKDKETKPNREKWDEIRGLLATQEAFKWSPRTQTFQRWGKISESEIATTSANLFRILGQYYNQEQVAETTMPTPEPQVQNEESMFKEGEKFRYIDTEETKKTIYTIEKITDDGRIFVNWKDFISGKEVTDWYWTSINGANKLLSEGRIEKIEDAQQPSQSIDYSRFATPYERNNLKRFDLLYYPKENKLIRVKSFSDNKDNFKSDASEKFNDDKVQIEFREESGMIDQSIFSFIAFEGFINRKEFIYLGEIEEGDTFEGIDISTNVHHKFIVKIVTQDLLWYDDLYEYTTVEDNATKRHFSFKLIDLNFRLVSRRGIETQQPSGELREITDTEAEHFADDIAFAYDTIIDKLNVSENQIYINDSIQEKFVQGMKSSLANLLKINSFIITDILNQSLTKIYKILEDRNYHLLNNFLALYGFYGDFYQREYTYDYATNPTRSLKPFKEETPTQTPTTTSDNEEIKFKRGNLLIVKLNGSINLIADVNPSESDAIVTHFFDSNQNGFQTIAFTEDYWRERIKSGEVVLLQDVEEGDVFQDGYDLTYYKVISTYENDKNVRYNIIGNMGQDIESFVMDKYDFKLKLVKNPFRFLFELPSVLQGQQPNQKEKLEKAIMGLEILAKRGNEKAQKAVMGLKILLKNLNK